MVRRRRKRGGQRIVGRAITALLAIPAAYMVAALVGSLVPVNSGWEEATSGTTVRTTEGKKFISPPP